MSEWNAPPPAGSQFKAPQHGLDALIHRLEQIELSVRNLANPPLLTTLVKAVADLTAQQSTLTAQQSTLTAQQATLAAQNAQIVAQQASLTAAVANIATLVGQQTTGAAAAPGTGAGFNVGTSHGTKASTVIAVPAGYSRALVVAIGSLTMADTAPNRFDTRCGIAGGYGASLPNAANPVGSTSAAHSRDLTGLSGGTITLEVQALAAVSATNGANTAIVTGFAIFFR